MRLALLILSFIVSLIGALASPCLAQSYLSNYRAAVELKAGSAAADLDYETVRSHPMPDACREKASDPLLMICTAGLGKASKLSYTLSLQQAFKRTGLWYFGADFGGSLFLLDAKASEEEKEGETPRILIRQPLQTARIHLYGGSARAYIQFGITPARILPDILISLGLGYHVSTGNLKMSDRREDLQVVAGIGYLQYEAVWWRFADGSLSSYVAQEFGANYRLKGEFGDYRNLRLKPSQSSFGLLKLVLPFKTK